MKKALAGAVPSPNIWTHPDVYERENAAMDPEQVVESAVLGLRDLSDATVVDVGCGTGYHLPTFAAAARRVLGVEPHTRNAARAAERVKQLSNVRVRVGVAQSLPIPDASVDLVHARLSYFFGPGCENGLAEFSRVLRRGGTAVVIDNDATRSTFGQWFRRSLPSYDPETVERFWVRRGFSRQSLDMGMRFTSRDDFEAVLGIEFAADLVAEFLADHEGLEVDYAVNLWTRHY